MHLNTKMNKTKMRNSNLFLTLRYLYQKESLSKTDLSQLTGLTLPSITSIINELLEYDLISEMGQTPIKRGRFPINYQINSDSFFIIAISIGSQDIKVAITNLDGDIKEFLKLPILSNPNSNHILNQIKDSIHSLIQQSSINENKILGIGIGMHGVVDSNKGIAIFPPHFDWKNIELKKFFESSLGYPVLVDNDCNVLTLAEHWFSRKRYKSLIVMNIDYGIGSGMIINGSLFHGSNYGTGQIGHITVDENGRKCSCGNYGCLETVVNETSIINKVNKRLKQGFESTLSKKLNEENYNLNYEDILIAANENDKLAMDCLEEAGRFLGKGITTMINLFNPEEIVLTGKIMKADKFILNPMISTVNKTALKTNVKNLKIRISDLGQYADLIGAATLWIDSFYKGKYPLETIFNKN